MAIPLPKVLSSAIFAASLLTSGAQSQTINPPEGFAFCTTLKQAQQYATSQNWRMSQILPGEWLIDGTNIGLFIRDNKVMAVRRQIDGGLDEFASIVFRLQRKWGKPDIQIAALNSGGGQISNIDTKFNTSEGQGIKVQFSSVNGKIGIFTNHWSKVNCDETKAQD
jgi:hypothetical protein